tara:strand:- start:148 stop:330 length:183 start_codon:yes stop_codon:yes gene_type:complete
MFDIDLNVNINNLPPKALREIRIIYNEQRQQLLNGVYQLNDLIANISNILLEKKEEEENG